MQPKISNREEFTTHLKTYEMVKSIVLERFPQDSFILNDWGGTIFMKGEYFYKHRSYYTLFVFRNDSEGILYPNNIKYNPNTDKIDVCTEIGEEAYTLDQYEHSTNLSIKQINEICDHIISQIKSTKEQIKLSNISKDF